MLESKTIRYFIYGSCAIISTELLYHSYLWFKKKLDALSSSQEVREVIWTNELTHYCSAKHRLNNRNSGGGATYNTSSPKAYSAKLNAKCANPFCSSKNVGRVIEYIDSAKYSIDLAMYTFTSFELSEAFVRALQRGVLIRIISDHEMAYSTGSQIIPLTKTGVPIRCNSNTVFMHHKFCILDSPRRVADIHKNQNKIADKYKARSILLTGSLNWTMQGFGGNWENILITSNMDFIRKYSEEFERMWRIFDVDLEADGKK